MAAGAPSFGAEDAAIGEARLAQLTEIPGEGEGTLPPDAADSTDSGADATPGEPPGFAGPRNRIEQAWLHPAAHLEERVTRTRRASLELGVWNLDAAARAVLAGGDGGDPLERAYAAVRLAPDLPAGRMALSKALWLHGEAPISAVRTAFGALAAIPRHLEASLWFGGSLLFVLGMSLVVAGMWCIALIGGAALPHAAHDLGDLLSGAMPAFARAALLASGILFPLALGEGLLGLCVALMAVGVVYGGLRQRLTVFLAALVVILGAFPVVHLAGNTLNAFSADPVVEAAFSTAQGFTHPVDQVRIEAAADSDPLAAQALAMRARRAGRLGEADAYYQALLRNAPEDPVITNNAANVRLNLGHMESALALYRRAAVLRPDPVVLFNLSQAHGRAFQVEELSRTLADAQRLNGDLVAELTSLQGAELIGFVVDLPIDTLQIWRRVFRSNQGEPIASEIRASFAPGRLGEDSLFAAGVFGAVLVVSLLLGSGMYHAHLCSRCRRRMCQRCDPETGGGAICGGCRQLFHQSETTDRELRLARERYAVVASFLVPGAAGLLANRPVRCLFGSVFATFGILALYWRDGVGPDPLVAGATAPFASLCIAVLAMLAYTFVVLLSIATRRNG
jgi:tetratricopeptide (TPR) repeat protein